MERERGTKRGVEPITAEAEMHLMAIIYNIFTNF